MFKLTKNTGGKQRLVATERLASADFDALARELGASPQRARKVGFVAAQKVKSRRIIETRWNGKETQITAQPHDWIVANLSPSKQILRDDEGNANLYVIGADKFPQLYERDQGANKFGTIYRAISEVEALYLPGGFEILAPWGETQRADKGYILRNGDDVYGNHKDTFEATYEIVG